jgi:hypothetical protein
LSRFALCGVFYTVCSAFAILLTRKTRKQAHFKAVKASILLRDAVANLTEKNEVKF